MARAPRPTIDPAQAAGASLRRLGFAILMLVVPVVPFVARRGIAVLVPIGIGLLVLAALLDGNRRGLRETLRRVLGAPATPAVLALLVWCGLSLIWTPFLGFAADRFSSIVAAMLLALAGYLTIPDRMRAANLYLMPVGVLLGAITAIAVASIGSAAGRAPEEDGQSLERGLVVLTLMLWPSVAWLHSRQRPWDALLLAIIVALATVLGPGPLPVLALSCGSVAFGLAVWRERRGARIVGGVMAGLILLAPVLPFLARPLAVALGPASPLGASLLMWRRLILFEPLRLVTGHGFETLVRGRLAGALPPQTPSTFLFELWYELGIVGAAAAAYALYWGTSRAAPSHPALLPGTVGAVAAAFALASLGIGTAQIWWFTVLLVLVLVFIACERGQFGTTRPKASLLTGARRPGYAAAVSRPGVRRPS